MLITLPIVIYIGIYINNSHQSTETIIEKEDVVIINKKKERHLDEKQSVKVLNSVAECDEIAFSSHLFDIISSNKETYEIYLTEKEDIVDEDIIEYHDLDLLSQSNLWDRKFYASLLQREEYDTALEFISNQEVPANKVYTFTIGLGIEIPNYFLQSLAYKVHEITFKDAIALSHSNADKTFLTGLRRVSGFDTRQNWVDNNKPNSLATIGIENLNFDLMEYWYDQGASLKFPVVLSDTYDKIKTPKTIAELKIAEKIFNFLKVQVGLPIKASTVKSLSVWLPSELTNDLKIITDKEHKPIDFGDLLSLVDVKYDNCVINDSENREVDTKIDGIINNITMLDNQYVNKILENTSINNHENHDFYTSFPKELNQLLGLIQSGQWDKSVSDIEIIFDKDNRKSAYDFVSELFLAMKAPTSEIQKIIQLGGSLNPSTLLNILPSNDINHLEIMDLFDIDWDVEIDGINALNVAVANNANQDIIEFLHAKGIQEKPDLRGLTPSDYIKKLTLSNSLQDN